MTKHILLAVLICIIVHLQFSESSQSAAEHFFRKGGNHTNNWAVIVREALNTVVV